MAGKLYLPSSDTPVNPPPVGSWILWIDASGNYKKMASDGVITNLTAQSVGDLTDVVVSNLQDGQFLKYDSASNSWVNTSSSVDVDADDIDDSNTINKFATQAELNQIATNQSGIITLGSELDSAEQSIVTNSSAIGTNSSNISGNSATILSHSSSIATNTTNISTNTGNISANTSAIADKEDDLGNPSVSGYVLSSSTSGVRGWVPMSGGSGGGGGDVSSVFGRTGAVLAENGDYNTDQVTEGATNKYITAGKLAEIDTNASNISVNAANISTNTGDIASNATDIGTNEAAIAANTSDISTKEPAISSASITDYYRGDKTFQTLNKNAVGLNNVDNTSDINKPLSNATTVALALKEGNLGNPSQSGYILSSTSSGTRSWVPAPSGGGGGAVDSWNGRTGIVAPQNNDYNADQISTSGTVNQFINSSDLAQISTNQSNISTNASNISTNTSAIGTNASNINTKEDDLGNPAGNGYILSSTTAGARSWIEAPSEVTIPVNSVFGRTGAITAQYGDYNADDITDETSVQKFATQSQLDQIDTNTTNIAGKEPTITAGTTSQYYRGDKTFQALNKNVIGLGNVDNTADADKPVSGLQQSALDAKLDSTLKGTANGLAELDAQGKVPTSQLPSYVSDIEEYANLASFPATGAADKIYVAIDTGYIYRWSGSTYVQLTDQTAVWGNVSGTLSDQTDLNSALNAKLDSSEKASANGVATLDADGKVELNQIPDGIAGGLTPTLMDLTGGVPTLEDGKAYLVKPDESNPAHNVLNLPAGSTGMSISVYDINYKFGTYNVLLNAGSDTIDGYDDINMDVDHCWLVLFYVDGEWKTKDPYAGG
ncbi:MAG: hypothetical protein CMJ82_10940 [Planctomycetaceae bacterium]|nr:hypothetical protein [Planctomycetaceae bacterium]